MISTTIITTMSINNITKNKSLSLDLNNHIEESFHLTWNDIVYDGGLGTWIPRSSFRWLTIFVCLTGIIGRLNSFFFNEVIIYIYLFKLGNILAVGTLLRQRMRSLSTYAYLTALCLSNTVTLISVIIFELDVLFTPNRFNCILVSLAKAIASSTFALSTW
jgi:hypothetical protein